MRCDVGYYSLKSALCMCICVSSEDGDLMWAKTVENCKQMSSHQNWGAFHGVLWLIDRLYLKILEISNHNFADDV